MLKFPLPLPIPRRRTDASAKNVSMVSGLCRSSKKTDAAGVVRGRVPTLEGARVEGDDKGKAGCGTPGQRAAGQQQKTYCPWVYTQPHPFTQALGPAHSSSPHTPPPTSCCHSSPSPSSLTTKLHRFTLEVGRGEGGRGAPVLRSICWINWVNGGKLGGKFASRAQLFTP